MLGVTLQWTSTSHATETELYVLHCTLYIISVEVVTGHKALCTDLEVL